MHQQCKRAQPRYLGSSSLFLAARSLNSSHGFRNTRPSVYLRKQAAQRRIRFESRDMSRSLAWMRMTCVTIGTDSVVLETASNDVCQRTISPCRAVSLVLARLEAAGNVLGCARSFSRPAWWRWQLARCPEHPTRRARHRCFCAG